MQIGITPERALWIIFEYGHASASFQCRMAPGNYLERHPLLYIRLSKADQLQKVPGPRLWAGLAGF
ncbi:hypothetical protein D3C74_496320 [compost metagenome]